MIRIHPSSVFLALAFILNGHSAEFTAFVTALLWHEMGHLFFLKRYNVAWQRCTIYPYGGEIVLESPYSIRYAKRFWIALGGPLFSFIGYLVCKDLPHLYIQLLAQAHLIILFINMIPIWPLDGGRMISSFLMSRKKGVNYFRVYLNVSLLVMVGVFFALIAFLPQTLFLLINALLIMIQLLQIWRERKYAPILEKTLYKELTS